MKPRNIYKVICLCGIFFYACNNEKGVQSNGNKDVADTNYSDSRRNSTGTNNTITGDSSATLDSAMHKGRQ